jgi:hypothetical protein
LVYCKVLGIHSRSAVVLEEHLGATSIGLVRCGRVRPSVCVCLSFGEALAVLDLDGRLHRFTPLFVGDTDGCGIGDSAKSDEPVLDLAGIGVHAFREDHVVYAI